MKRKKKCSKRSGGGLDLIKKNGLRVFLSLHGMDMIKAVAGRGKIRECACILREGWSQGQS